MIIRYANGRSFEAVLLSQTDNTMRLAIQGQEDCVTLTLIDGIWVSEDCEAVTVEYSWESKSAPAEPAEEDCICSRDLAAKLIHILYYGEDEVQAEPLPAAPDLPEGALRHII